MDLLTFARGPGLAIGLTIFAFGITWRLAGIVLLAPRRDLAAPRAAPRPGGAWLGGLRLIVSRSLPRRAFWPRTASGATIGYVLHFGLLIVVAGLAQHILYIGSMTGLSWPNLPAGVVQTVAGLTIAALVGAFIRRRTNPVLRLLSNADDYIAIVITLLPLLTGVMANMHVGLPYPTMLALHMLSFALLLAWFPFGKLMHGVLVFASRGATGRRFARMGAST